MRGNRLTAWLVLPIVALVLGSCSTGGSGGATVPVTTPRWIAGASLVAFALPLMVVPTYNASQGGNGFVYDFVGTIESFAVAKLGSNRPATMLVTGGLNDAVPSRGISVAETITAMQHFEDTMTGLGIRTVWITEPVYSVQPQEIQAAMALTNGWMMTRPFHADCALATTTVAGAGSIDGVHPNGASALAYAQCIDAAG